MPCNLCGSQSGLQRDQMTALIDRLEQTIPNVREVMLASLKNVRTSHLLDPKLLGLSQDTEVAKGTEALPETLHQIAEPTAENAPN